MVKYITSRLKEINSFLKETSAGIDTEDEKFKSERKALLKIKENTTRVEQEKDQNLLDLEVIEQALVNFKEVKKERAEDFETTQNMITDLRKLEEDVNLTEQKISANLKEEKANCRNELNDFEKEMKKYFLGLKNFDIYQNYKIGVKRAFEEIEGIEEKIDLYNERLKDFTYYTEMFKMEEGTGGAYKVLNKI